MHYTLMLSRTWIPPDSTAVVLLIPSGGCVPEPQFPLLAVQVKDPALVRRNAPTSLPSSGFPRHRCPLRFQGGVGFQTMGRTTGKATPWSCYSLIPPWERLAWRFKAGAGQNTCGDESTSQGCAGPRPCPGPALRPGSAQEPLQELRRMGLMVLTAPELCSNQLTLGIQGSRGALTTRGR